MRGGKIFTSKKGDKNDKYKTKTKIAKILFGV